MKKIINVDLNIFGEEKPKRVEVEHKVFQNVSGVGLREDDNGEQPVFAGAIVFEEEEREYPDGTKYTVQPCERVMYLDIFFEEKKKVAGKTVKTKKSFEGWVLKSEVPLFRASIGMDNDMPVNIYQEAEDKYIQKCLKKAYKKRGDDVELEDIVDEFS